MLKPAQKYFFLSLIILPARYTFALTDLSRSLAPSLLPRLSTPYLHSALSVTGPDPEPNRCLAQQR